MDHDGTDIIYVHEQTIEETGKTIRDTQDLIDNFWNGITSTEVTHALQCKLYRQEEINLYYQCTQLAYNNYALDHFGGDFRSYPTWLAEVYRCNAQLEDAEVHTIYDALHYKEEFPCTPSAITLPMPWPFIYQKWTRFATKFDRADGLA